MCLWKRRNSVVEMTHSVSASHLGSSNCSTPIKMSPGTSSVVDVCLIVAHLTDQGFGRSASTDRNDQPCPSLHLLQQRISDMKHLLSGVAIIAALALAAPASAQRSGPGPGAWTGTGPGVIPPGGPGPSSPLSNLPAGSPGLATPWWTAPWPAYYAPPPYYAPYAPPYYSPPPGYYYGPAAR